MMNPTADPVAGIAEFQQEIDSIESTFGRITYVANLRDRRTGLYHHRMLQNLPAEQAQNVLFRAHRSLFNSWLSCPIEEQIQDFQKLLDDLPADSNPTALGALWTSRQLADIVPPDAVPFERAFFLSEAQLVIALATAQRSGTR